MLFDHLGLFRISDFEFGASPWRALRPFDLAQGMLCASYRFANSATQMLTCWRELAERSSKSKAKRQMVSYAQ